MAGPAAVNAGTALGNIIGNLTPGQWGRLFGHMTQSDASRALQMMMSMQMNPAMAPALLPSIESIPNLPPEVTTWLTQAISNPANFQTDMGLAEAALQRSLATGIGALGL